MSIAKALEGLYFNVEGGPGSGRQGGGGSKSFSAPIPKGMKKEGGKLRKKSFSVKIPKGMKNSGGKLRYK